LLAGTVADVGDACGVEGGPTSGVGASFSGGGSDGSGGSGGIGSAGGEAAGARDEPAAGLACLGLRTDARADTRRARAAARGAVSGIEALPADELLARAVAYIGDTCGVERRATSCSSGCGCGSCGGGTTSSGRSRGRDASIGGRSTSLGREDFEGPGGVEDGLKVVTDDRLEFVGTDSSQGKCILYSLVG
jgi:hypothetical protein